MSNLREDNKINKSKKLKNFVFFNRDYTAGDYKLTKKEKILKNINFKKIIFNKPKGNNNNLIVCCFSEFGCETVGIHYILPRIRQNNPDKRIIVVGWVGRSFLYSHLADEFWEIDADLMWLKDYSRAFHHESKNIKWVEKHLKKFGEVITSIELGNIALIGKCRSCKNVFGSDRVYKNCEHCNSDDLELSLFSDTPNTRNTYKSISYPRLSKIKKAGKIIKENTVALFVRGRNVYGRNFTPEQYYLIVSDLIKSGYNVLWLGEKYTTFDLKGDFGDKFYNLCNHPDFNDIEFVLAALTHCKFSLQFWTASTRLAAMINLPYVLVESPDQIVGRGQEGTRLILTTKDEENKKIIFCNHLNVVENFWDFRGLLKNSIFNFVVNRDFTDVIGMVDNFETVKSNYFHNDGFWNKIFKNSMAKFIY
jgi:hypothetical protein